MEEITNNSDPDELKSATLDQLYKEQVRQIRDLILKNPECPDIEKCRKWMNVFNHITRAEMVARNCLCMLMHQQIANYGCLGYPFTNLDNCKRNLESVLKELDKQSRASTKSYDVESVSTFKSHNVSLNDFVCDKHTGCPNKFNAESIQLQLELDELRLQLSEQRIENEKLKDIAEKFRINSETNKRILDDIKTEILGRMRDKLLQMNAHYNGVIIQLKLFETIFQVYSKDLQFMETIRKFDMNLESILSRHMEVEISKQKGSISHQIARKFLRKDVRVREKYERRLTIQSMAQRLQLKLAKLKCFSVLRQIFIHSHTEIGKVDLWDVLKILEEKYQAVVKDI